MVLPAVEERLRAELGQRVHAMRRALSDEVRSMQAGGGRPIELRDGVRVADSEGGSLYSFAVDRELTVPADTEVAVSAPGLGVVEGSLVASHDFDVILHLRSTDDIRTGRLVLTPWKINRKLRARLQEPAPPAGLRRAAELLGLTPVPEGEAAIDLAALNDEQATAVRRAAARPLHYVWGPPGTGKTATLAATVRALVGRGERVLVVSHANVAVDVAMLRVADAFEGTSELAEGRVLRIGPVHHPDARARADILPESQIARTDPELDTRRRGLEARRAALAKRLRGTRDARLVDELEAIRQALAAYRKTLEEAQQRLLADARVIGTTLARAVLHDPLYTWPADAVVVDETGMAPFPAILALALRGPSRVLLFGDFRQLAPVSTADTPFAREWLHRDAFHIGGVTSRCDAGLPEARVTMLRVQHRMAPRIAETVSRLAYDGRLLTAPAAAFATAPLALRGPWPGRAVTIVDTSALRPAACQEAAGGSRLNPLQAAIALDLYRAFGSDVGLVTPYRAQARLLAAALERGGDAATVHRFQGSERDVMVVDLVDAPWVAGPSPLTGREPEPARRLLNVALSRARGRVVLLADVAFVRRTHPASSPIRALVDAADADIVPALPPWAASWSEAQHALARDLRGADRAVVHLPAGFDASPALLEAMRGVPSLTLFADPAVAQRLEDDDRIDLRLLHPPGGFFAIVADAVAHVGGHTAFTPIARVEEGRFAATLRQLLLGPTLPWGLRSAAVEEAIRLAAGRCAACGEARRPRPAWDGWIFRCEDAGHAAVRVDRAALQPIAEELACPGCKMPGVVKGEPPDLWIECAGGSCAGRMPSLEELLGGTPDWRS